MSRNPPKMPPPKAADTCARKRRYPDEVLARAMGSFVIEKGCNVTELYTYRCEVCRGWHLTRWPVGAAIFAHDPHSEERKDAEVLATLQGGVVTTYFNCEHGDREDQAWLHQSMLRLEHQGKVIRFREHGWSIRWKAA